MTSNTGKWALRIALCMSCLFAGCAQRKLAPELHYQQEQVKQFDEKISNFDW